MSDGYLQATFQNIGGMKIVVGDFAEGHDAA
jgi:hypothetical protein